MNQRFSNALVPVLSVVAAVLVASVILIVTGANPVGVITSLIEGAFLKPNAFANTLVTMTPYIMLGLGVSVAFGGGLFNIGAEGQFYLGAVAGTLIGYAVPGLPAFIHVPLTMFAGALMGALWAGIAGALKAWRGAHEVITTIMLNYVAFALTDYLINNPMRGKGSAPRTPDLLDTAILPKLFGEATPVHLGLVIALLLVVGYWFLTSKTPLGFAIRTVGSNPDAARYAGIDVKFTMLRTMLISGGLCGIAGAIEVQGVYHYMPAVFTVGYGFDSIAIALLGQGGPVGIVLASLLFGAFGSGSGNIQFATGVNPGIIDVLKAFILIFVGAPAIIRGLLRMNKEA